MSAGSGVPPGAAWAEVAMAGSVAGWRVHGNQGGRLGVGAVKLGG